jgi:uncharacterized sulfatase
LGLALAVRGLWPRLVLLAALSLGASVGLAPAAQAHSSRPNIVLIFADDLGWADLPVYGNRITEAPNIEMLASQGARFTRFYSQPVCSPSRAELLSGQYPVRFGLTDFVPGHWRPFEKTVTPRTVVEFAPNLPTMGSVLSQRGYRTAYFGKWHLGGGEAAPAAHGFDEFNIGYGLNHMADPTTPTTNDIARRADTFIAEANGRPFLLVLSPTVPHIPLRAHEMDVAYFQARLEEEGAEFPVAPYAAMVRDFDRLVGSVMETLARHGLARDTLFVVTSDNGALEYLDLGLNDTINSNDPLRGEKGTVYEGGLRIPLLIRWPGVALAGSVIDEPAALMDLLPTFAAAAGVEIVDRDGIDLAPVLRDPTVRFDQCDHRTRLEACRKPGRRFHRAVRPGAGHRRK